MIDEHIVAFLIVTNVTVMDMTTRKQIYPSISITYITQKIITLLCNYFHYILLYDLFSGEAL